MELDWDEAKRKANQQKHGLDFDDARHLDWDVATYIEDTRFAYPERRYWAFAKDSGGRLHVVTFCIRGSEDHQLSQSQWPRGQTIWLRRKNGTSWTIPR